MSNQDNNEMEWKHKMLVLVVYAIAWKEKATESAYENGCRTVN